MDVQKASQIYSHANGEDFDTVVPYDDLSRCFALLCHVNTQNECTMEATQIVISSIGRSIFGVSTISEP